MVRKLGAPGHPELAMGALAAAGERVELVRNEVTIDRLRIGAPQIEAVRRREMLELHRRTATYRGHRPAALLAGRVVIVVDDGLATGSTMLAAVTAIARHRPARLVVAVAVGPEHLSEEFRGVDDFVCAFTPRPFRAVRDGYQDFAQTSDTEVLDALTHHRGRPTST